MFKTGGPYAPSVCGMAPLLNGIGLAVADMATSLAFYRRLGLALPPEADHEPHAEAELPGGIRLMWDTHAALTGFDPNFTPGAGGPSLAFLCSDATEVDRVHAELSAAGHASVKAPWDAPWGQRYATVQDPDGHQVDLFAWTRTPSQPAGK
jgi:catechol 2,3-dioxygenase-like lactoylglutathione lyase family enzyme